MSAPALRGYYAILDWKGHTPPDMAALRARATTLMAAGPCCLQLRAKGLAARALREAATALLSVCRPAGVPLCVNDRLDVALSVGAQMVHLGQEDLPLAEARRVAEGALTIGVSTHDEAQARAAFEGGADYIGFGPIFATRTKERPDPVVGLTALARVVKTLPLPVVAIGGIDLESVNAVAATGAAAAAVISAVDEAVDTVAAGWRVSEAFRLHAAGPIRVQA